MNENDKTVWHWVFGPATFDEGRWELVVNGAVREIERKPLEVLRHLLKHAGEVVTKDELIDKVWMGRVVVEAVLTNAIVKLRKALEDEEQSIIATIPRVGYRLQVPVSRKPAILYVPPAQLAIGDAVPRRTHWRLTERLARNADSEVWVAKHAKTDEVRVFKFSLDGVRLHGLKREVTLSRVLRSTLGDRPEFTRIIDWDFTEAPYFVEFEYGGESFDQWLKPDTPMKERLDAMAQLAAAVGTAHDVGVLHKDLKPANVLVNSTNGANRIQVTDFGSGRMFDSDMLKELGITQLGMTMTQGITVDSMTGTPLYLAPELLDGYAPTIKSDLYALGVMLYQLAVGDFRRPMSAGWESHIDDPILRQDIAQFANGDPAKRPDSAHDLATRLQTLPKRHAARDVEQAVNERIAIAEKQLALNKARRPWVIAAGSALVLGLGFTGFYGYKANQSAAAERLANDKASKALETQTALNDFLTKDVISAANPDQNDGKMVSVKDALISARDKIDSRFGNDYAARNSVRMAMGKAFDSMLMPQDAVVEYKHAYDDAVKAYGENSPQAIDATFAQVFRLAEMGQMDVALKMIQDAEARVTKLGDKAPMDLRIALERNQFNYWYRAGKLAKGLEHAQRAQQLVNASPNADPILRLNVLIELMQAHYHTNDWQRGVDAGLDALKAAKAMGLPDTNSRVQRLRNYLAMAYMHNGQIKEADEQLRIQEPAIKSVFGDQSGNYASVLQTRGDLAFAAGKYNEAIPLFRRAIEIYYKVLGPRTSLARDNIPTLAESYRLQGNAKQAEKELMVFLDAIRADGRTPFQTCSELTMVWMLTQLDLGSVDAARQAANSCGVEKIWDQTTPGDRLDTQIAQVRARIAIAEGRKDDARKILERSSVNMSKDPVDGPYVAAIPKLMATLK